MKNEYEVRGDHVAIFIKRRWGHRLETLVDLADFEKISQYPGSWTTSKVIRGGKEQFYVYGNLYTWDTGTQQRVRGRAQSLSRYLLGNPPGLFVDHISGETLDNRRGNLRPATRILNSLNRAKKSRRVFPHVDGWRADIAFKKKIYWLGTFANESDARSAFAGALALATALAVEDTSNEAVK